MSELAQDVSADIVRLLREKGTAQYGGEAVSQLEHALQCAHLAERRSESTELIVACLLHDLGHLISLRTEAQHSTVDDMHQFLAIPFLRPHFPAEVVEPIRLHVDAKRYLCATDNGYWSALSDASKRSLELQGGPFNDDDAHKFVAHPHAQAAIRLRRYDDEAKLVDVLTPRLDHYRQMLDACRLTTTATSER